MLQHHLLRRAARLAEASEKDAVLRFDPVLAVQAIVFHLLDEHLAKGVSPETIRRTMERLATKSISLSIARRRWVTMTNGQRLKWLLSESETTTLITENDFVLLRARRSRVA